MQGNAEYWNSIFERKQPTEVSWYEARPDLSLTLVTEACQGISRPHIIDVGGGASLLVDHLLAQMQADITVVDISAHALAAARQRLGDRSKQVTWVEADITAKPSLKPCDVWHDRAAYHFLIDAQARSRYVSLAAQTVRRGGRVILGCFALDGPEKCSGLQVRQNSADGIAHDFGNKFKLVDARVHDHHTPAGTLQKFAFAQLVRQ